jgi:predicted pyridoxine 5'-phosphate oxidase superfamily flavin-nucleotide-binding protein
MKLSAEMRLCLDQSVLCWVATADDCGRPNVSPKEVFASDLTRILIAHIASPKTVRNIEFNSQVMVSVVDVFAQQGWQFAGEASLVWADSSEFDEVASPLNAITHGLYPMKAVLVVDVHEAKRIVAPSSWLFPDKPADLVRKQVLSRYGVEELSVEKMRRWSP